MVEEESGMVQEEEGTCEARWAPMVLSERLV